MFAIIQAAGWPIWPLLAASIIALALIFERLATLRRAKVVPTGLLENVIGQVRAGSLGDAAVAALEKDSPLGRVLAAGVRLGVITEATRTTLRCVYVDGRTSVAAAEILGATPAAIRQRCSQGVRALRAAAPDLVEQLAG